LIILKKTSEYNHWLKSQSGRKLGFVPTMGALHQGHLSLIKSAQQLCDKVVVSIFINPMQFNNKEDFEKYPINTQNDIAMLQDVACDVLFLPDVKEIYPANFKKATLEIDSISTQLEGHFRPGHFDGVVQVLFRLFEIVKPHHVFFGLKDFQQCLVVRKLIKKYFKHIQLHLVATLREENGLAMSSRNIRLSENGRKKAGYIYKGLSFAKEQRENYAPLDLEATVVKLYKDNDIIVEYVSIVDADSLIKIERWESDKNYIILTAVYIDEVRLIDNLFI
jgi:pantoate--beta-alanine ligase